MSKSKDCDCKHEHKHHEEHCEEMNKGDHQKPYPCPGYMNGMPMPCMGGMMPMNQQHMMAGMEQMPCMGGMMPMHQQHMMAGMEQMPCMGGMMPMHQQHMMAGMEQMPCMGGMMPMHQQHMMAGMEQMPCMGGMMPMHQQHMMAGMEQMPCMSGMMPMHQQHMMAGMEQMPCMGSMMPMHQQHMMAGMEQCDYPEELAGIEYYEDDHECEPDKDYTPWWEQMNMENPALSEEAKCLLKNLMEIDFAIIELNLYLTTHPMDRRALAQHNRYVEMRKPIVDRLTRVYGPLTQIENIGYPWAWLNQPWPWRINF